MTADDITGLIEADGQMMAALRAARSLNLPDWWIGAGFVRNKIWNLLEGGASVAPGDIDVIYFDPSNTEESHEKELDAQLERLLPTGMWSVKNQARMHSISDNRPYVSTLDAVAQWPETATAVAVTLGPDGHVIFAAPHGTDDLLKLVIRPTPYFAGKMDDYRKRLAKKRWQEKWPSVKVIGE